jgi:mono/diheme cytochrome c family protein
MKLKALFTAVAFAGLSLASCGSGNDKPKDDQTQAEAAKLEHEEESSKGIGKFTTVELTHPLDEKMVAQGKSIYDVKCGSCHKLSEEKLVGPGWKGVTDRRQPEWIMNFVTNVDEMLNKDPNAQAMLEVCMVRMPNQNLKDDEARAILEFMRKNDGKN